jgi:hypothetical protein
MAFVTKYWPSRLASDRAPPSFKTGVHSPRDLHASFEDMLGPSGPFSPFFTHWPKAGGCVQVWQDILSQGSQRSPLHRSKCRSSSPRRCSKELLPSTRGRYTSCAGRPCRFARLRRSTPTDSLQVCCTLLTVMGFTTFPVRSSRLRAEPRCRVPIRFPIGLAIPVARHPSKRSPRQKLCVASPRPIPSRRFRRCRLSVSACCHAGPGRLHAPARPQGLVPLPSPLLPPGVATWKPLVAPLGFVPSRCVALPESRQDRGPGWMSGSSHGRSFLLRGSQVASVSSPRLAPFCGLGGSSKIDRSGFQ